MNQEKFIQSLKNGEIDVEINRAEMQQLDDASFQPFNANIVVIEEHTHRWDSIYFNSKFDDLKFNFSKELINHLLEVKAYLQAQGVDTTFKVNSNTTKSENEDSISKPMIDAQTIIPQAKCEMEKAPSSPTLTKADLTNFQPNERLSSLLKENDLTSIRTDLMSALNNRRLALEEVGKTIWYVYKHKPDVFEKDEDSAFVQSMNNDENVWDVDYFTKQQVYLNNNFSLARLLHLLNVRETLMKRGDKHFQQIEVKKNKESQPKKDHKQHSSSTTQPNTTHSKNTEYNQQTGTNGSQTSHQQQTAQNENMGHSKADNKFIKTVILVGGSVLVLFGAVFFFINN